jgi:hypothetical protein
MLQFYNFLMQQKILTQSSQTCYLFEKIFITFSLCYYLFQNLTWPCPNTVWSNKKMRFLHQFLARQRPDPTKCNNVHLLARKILRRFFFNCVVWTSHRRQPFLYSWLPSNTVESNRGFCFQRVNLSNKKVKIGS